MLGLYRMLLDTIVEAFRASITGRFHEHFDPRDREGSLAVLVPVLTEIVRSARKASHTAAGDFIREQAANAGVDSPYIPPLARYPDLSVETVLREAFSSDAESAVADVVSRLEQHVEDAARQTVVRAAEDGRDPSTREERERWSHGALSPEEFEETVEKQAGEQARRRRGKRRPQLCEGMGTCTHGHGELRVLYHACIPRPGVLNR